VHGSKRLATLGASAPAGTTNQNLWTYLYNESPPTPKNRPEAKYIYASWILMGAWLHVLNKQSVDGTILLVGIGPGCAAYEHFKKCGIKGCVRQDVCDVLLVDANGKPGPGILVAEATEHLKNIRILHNTLDG
jgi:hypothetical protein